MRVYRTGELDSSTRCALSFRGAALGREPGIHNPQRCGVWIPGPPLRGVPE